MHQMIVNIIFHTLLVNNTKALKRLIETKYNWRYIMSAKKILSGAALALAAASFVGCASQTTDSDTMMAEENVHCYGVNSCKGHNDCGGENNSCKGMGSCKGTGFLSMSAEECSDKGGTVK